MPPHRIFAPATARRYLLAGTGVCAGQVPTRAPVSLACRAQGIRHAATTASKSPATKKKTSTKSTATAATPKKATAPSAGPAVAPAKKATRASPAATAPVKHVTQASPSVVKVKAAAQPKIKTADPTPTAPGPKPVSASPTQAKAAAAPTRSPPAKATTAPRSPAAAPGGPPKSPAQVDTGSKEYRRATWSYTGAVVGVPLLLVTSYFLYDRLILGNERLDTFRLSPPPGQESAPVPDDGAKATNQ